MIVSKLHFLMGINEIIRCIQEVFNYTVVCDKWELDGMLWCTIILFINKTN